MLWLMEKPSEDVALVLGWSMVGEAEEKCRIFPINCVMLPRLHYSWRWKPLWILSNEKILDQNSFAGSNWDYCFGALWKFPNKTITCAKGINLCKSASSKSRRRVLTFFFICPIYPIKTRSILSRPLWMNILSFRSPDLDFSLTFILQNGDVVKRRFEKVEKRRQQPFA